VVRALIILNAKQVSASIATMGICFAPTMRSFVIATTDGVLLYSLDNGNHFDPYHLEAHIKPATIKMAIQDKQYLTAIMQSLKLNDETLVRVAIEKVPHAQIAFVVASLPLLYCERALSKLGVLLESNRHLEFLLIWIDRILRTHGLALKNMSSNTLPSVLRLLQRNLMRHLDDLDQVCTGNKYTLRVLNDLHEHWKLNPNAGAAEDEPMMDEEVEDEEDDAAVSDSDDEMIQKMLNGEVTDDDQDSDDTTSRATPALDSNARTFKRDRQTRKN
jgi:hypothetical protein